MTHIYTQKIVVFLFLVITELNDSAWDSFLETIVQQNYGQENERIIYIWYQTRDKIQ